MEDASRPDEQRGLRPGFHEALRAFVVGLIWRGLPRSRMALMVKLCALSLRCPSARWRSGFAPLSLRIATNLLRDYWRRHRSTPIDEIPEELFATRGHARGPMRRPCWDRHWRSCVRATGNCSGWPRDSDREIAEVTGLASASIRLLLFPRGTKPLELATWRGHKIRGAAMSPFSCPRESESRTSSIAAGSWRPLAFSEELRAHVAAAVPCGESAGQETFLAARATAMAVPVLPSAASLWRAQLRRRTPPSNASETNFSGAQIFALGNPGVLGCCLATARLCIRWDGWRCCRALSISTPSRLLHSPGSEAASGFWCRCCRHSPWSAAWWSTSVPKNIRTMLSPGGFVKSEAYCTEINADLCDYSGRRLSSIPPGPAHGGSPQSFLPTAPAATSKPTFKVATRSSTRNAPPLLFPNPSPKYRLACFS